MVFSQQLPQEPWIPANSSRPLTEFIQFWSSTEAAKDFRDEVDLKKAKSFGWIKEHALWGPNSQILAIRRSVSQSLRAHAQTRKHWGREWAKYGAGLLIR